MPNGASASDCAARALSTRKRLARAWRRSSSSRRDLPTPGRPSISTDVPDPLAAPASSRVSSPSSAPRSSSGAGSAGISEPGGVMAAVPESTRKGKVSGCLREGRALQCAGVRIVGRPRGAGADTHSVAGARGCGWPSRAFSGAVVGGGVRRGCPSPGASRPESDSGTPVDTSARRQWRRVRRVELWLMATVRGGLAKSLSGCGAPGLGEASPHPELTTAPAQKPRVSRRSPAAGRATRRAVRARHRRGRCAAAGRARARRCAGARTAPRPPA